jgi:hypothetical protein
MCLCRAIHGGTTSKKVVHRIALFDKSQRITHIISQSDIARSVALLLPVTARRALSPCGMTVTVHGQ